MDVSGSLGEEQKDEELQSPQRKKKKQYNRKDKKDKNQKAEAELILCPGKFGNARVGDKRQICMPSKLQHFHKHSRVYMDASITLEVDDKHMEFTQMIGKLIFNTKKVYDHFVINSCKKGGNNLSEMTDVPMNMTELGGNIQVSGNSRSFEMKRQWKMDRKQGDLDEYELKHPEVYFSFAMSCNIEPVDLLNRISFEWGEMKGRRLQIKDLPSFLSETPFTLYDIYNPGNWPSIIRELSTIMGKAKDTARTDKNLEEEYEARPIPPMTF